MSRVGQFRKRMYTAYVMVGLAVFKYVSILFCLAGRIYIYGDTSVYIYGLRDVFNVWPLSDLRMACNGLNFECSLLFSLPEL